MWVFFNYAFLISISIISYGLYISDSIHCQSYGYRYMETHLTLSRNPSQKCAAGISFSFPKMFLKCFFLDHATVSFLWVRLWWQVRILVKEDFPLVLDFFFSFFWFLSEMPSSSMMALKERHWRTGNKIKHQFNGVPFLLHQPVSSLWLHEHKILVLRQPWVHSHHLLLHPLATRLCYLRKLRQQVSWANFTAPFTNAAV